MNSCWLSLAANSIILVGLQVAPAHGWISLVSNTHRRHTWISRGVGTSDGPESEPSRIVKVDTGSSIEPSQPSNSTGSQFLTPGGLGTNNKLSSIGRSLRTRFMDRGPNWLTQKKVPHGLGFLILVIALRTHCACSSGTHPPNSVSSAGSEISPAARLADANSAEIAASAEMVGPRTRMIERPSLQLPNLPKLPESVMKAVVNVSLCAAINQ